MRELLRTRYESTTNTELARLLGISKTSVTRQLAFMGLERSSDAFKGVVAAQFSERNRRIECHEKAVGIVPDALANRTALDLAWRGDFT
jgi:hypothetical protein